MQFITDSFVPELVFHSHHLLDNELFSLAVIEMMISRNINVVASVTFQLEFVVLHRL